MDLVRAYLVYGMQVFGPIVFEVAICLLWKQCRLGQDGSLRPRVRALTWAILGLSYRRVTVRTNPELIDLVRAYLVYGMQVFGPIVFEDGDILVIEAV